MNVFRNVQIGFPIVYTSDLIPVDEFNDTLVTSTRYLPKIMVEAGIVSSTSEVRRNRPDLCITFPDDMTDCIEIKWGKKFLYIIVGKKDPIDPLKFYITDENLIGYSFDGINWSMTNRELNAKDIPDKEIPLYKEEMWNFIKLKMNVALKFISNLINLYPRSCQYIPTIGYDYGSLYQCKVHLIHVFKDDVEINPKAVITHFLWR